MKNKLNLIILWLLACLSFSCSENSVEGSSVFNISTNNLTFDYTGGSQTVHITSSGHTSDLKYKFSNNGDDWCIVNTQGPQLTVQAVHSYQTDARTTQLDLSLGNQHQILTVSQDAAPGTSDTEIKITSATADSEETKSTYTDSQGNKHPLTLKMSYDKNKETYYNSAFGAVKYPFTITYELEAGHTLNRIIYQPRTDSGNKWGMFESFTVEASTNEKPDDFQKIGDYTISSLTSSPFEITLVKPVNNVKKVRFVINEAYQDRVSCAEMEFWESSKNAFDVSSIFKDKVCSQLKDGVSIQEINQIPVQELKALGIALFNKTYSADYRLASYRPYQDPAIMAAKNKTSKYSRQDGVTGLYATAGKEITAIVGDLYEGAKISLLIQNLNGGFNNFKMYSLKEGYNKITPEIGGLMYIVNLVQDDVKLLPETAAEKELVARKTVQIHFPMADVNGYFDIAKNKESDWNTILKNAKYQDINVLGKYSHLTWKVKDFVDNNTDIIKTIENLDKLVYLEESLLGLVKYNKMFQNRMHFCIDYKAASPNASDYRTVYNASTYYAEPFCKPDQFAARLWGPAHEVGHCNQVRPGVKWAGMTEVTNNIMSLYVQQQFGRPSKLLNDKAGSTGLTIYDYAKQLFGEEHRAHSLPGVSSIIRETQLVPFWKLKLYFMDVKGTDFYPDLYEHYRITDNLDTSKDTQGILQLDFVRQVCKLTNMNLLDFFRYYGFLTPVNTTLNDYGNKKFIITQSQIDALEKEIKSKNYKEAPKYLYDITEDNLSDYK